MCDNSGRSHLGTAPLVRLEMVPRFAAVLPSLKYMYVSAYPHPPLVRKELTIMPVSTDRNRDLGLLQPTPKCLPGSCTNWPFLKNSNTLTQTRHRLTHLCHLYSLTSTSRREISSWMRGTNFGSSTSSSLASIPSGSSM